MNKTRAIGARSLAAIIAVTLTPAIAHADDGTDIKSQLAAMAAAMKAMQQQQEAMLQRQEAMQANEQALERRLAESEAKRAALAAQTSVPDTAKRAGRPALASADNAAVPVGTAPSTAVPTSTVSGQPVPEPVAGHDSIASSELLHPPPGTIGTNPEQSGKATPAGKGASFAIPGINTRFTFGGMVKFDAYDDISGANLNTVPTDASSIPIDGTSQARRRGQLMMTARQTRFNVGSETQTDWGALRSFIEVDFYGTGGTALITNPVAPRLRHAYLSLGRLTFGQTWSVFFDLDASPETLDLTGAVGNSYAIRQPLIRYQMPLGRHSQLTLGIENPDADFLGADQSTNFPIGSTLSTRVLNQVPDFTARYTYANGPIRLSAAGVVRYINLDTGGASLPFLGPNGTFYYGGHASTWGFGGQIDAKIKTWGKDTFTIEANGGPGIGRYLMEPQDAAFAIGVAPNGAVNANPGSGAVLGIDGKLRSIFSWGLVASYRHVWSSTLRSNFVLGYQKIGDPDGTLPVNFPDIMTSIHTNLIWSPLPQVGFGFEYIRESLALRGQTPANEALGYGNSGITNRIQFTAQYNLF